MACLQFRTYRVRALSDNILWIHVGGNIIQSQRLCCGACVRASAVISSAESECLAAPLAVYSAVFS